MHGIVEICMPATVGGGTVFGGPPAEPGAVVDVGGGEYPIVVNDQELRKILGHNDRG
jgi:hypothetical protein